jgi:hypothetical protein
MGHKTDMKRYRPKTPKAQGPRPKASARKRARPFFPAAPELKVGPLGIFPATHQSYLAVEVLGTGNSH